MVIPLVSVGGHQTSAPTQTDGSGWSQASRCSEGQLGLSNDHLIPEHRLSGPFCTPRLGSPDDKLAPFKEPRHVVVEIEESEAKAAGWQPGYYLLPLTPKEASTRLGQS